MIISSDGITFSKRLRKNILTIGKEKTRNLKCLGNCSFTVQPQINERILSLCSGYLKFLETCTFFYVNDKLD